MLLNQKRHQHVLALLGCLLSFAVVPTSEAKIKYGMWEITVQAHATGIPMEIPAETFKKCISRRSLTPGSNADKKSCGKMDVKRNGDTVNWNVSCTKDGDKMNGGGTVTYKGDGMSGKGFFEAGGKGMPTMKMQIKYSGKRLGKCK
ncbi:MAG: DUF3617 domain-containing protein [Gammaproteobacteria bacterium]|nr:DUF3617 domain-containing protein [Gammaproteobacteria bacterium]MDH5777052.1 DUF3617 domain-containing protein [Gammaproteobacteria bacterium]